MVLKTLGFGDTIKSLFQTETQPSRTRKKFVSFEGFQSLKNFYKPRAQIRNHVFFRLRFDRLSVKRQNGPLTVKIVNNG